MQPMPKYKNITGVITWLVAIVTAMVIIISPLAFFFHSYQNLSAMMETEAEINAERLTHIISSNPDYWEFEDIRLTEYLQNRPKSGIAERRRIVNKKNIIVSEDADALHSPLIMRSAEIMDSGVVAGRLEIYRSLRPLLKQTGLVFLLILPLGLGIFFILRILPINSLMLAETALINTNKDMETINNLLHGKILECRRIEEELYKLNEELEARVAERTLQLSTEIDEHKQTEEALRNSEKKYRLLTEKMFDIVFVMNLDLRTTYVSPSIKAQLGFTPEERLAQDVHEQITPESLAVVLDVLAKEQELEQQGDVDPERNIAIEVEYYHKDGSTRWVENIMSWLRDDRGVAIGIHGVARDITERRQAETALQKSEKKYRELVDFLPISLYEMDIQGNIISGNPEIFRTFGYVQDDLKHDLNSFRMLISAQDLGRAIENMKGIITGEKTEGTEYTGIRKDGSTFPFLNIAGPIMSGDKPVGLRGAIIDLSKQKQAERELQNVREMLLQSEKLAAIGRLSAGVAHEILNPVNIISMELQILQDMESLSPDVQEELNVCMGQISRIVTITENLKMFSRVQGKKMIVANINNVIDYVLGLHATQLKIEEIKTEVHYRPDLPEIVMDREKIEEVILNMISNAMASMEGKEKKILRITTDKEILPGDRDQLVIMIADTGTGIKSEDMSKIFDPFYTTKEPGKGTGLGLSISYGIIHDHDGLIHVENNEWGGASFYIKLPIKTDMNEKLSQE